MNLRRVILGWCLVVAAGCSVCHTTPTAFYGVAIGHAYCERTLADNSRVRNEGGAMSNNAAELFGTIVTAAEAYYTSAATGIVSLFK